MAKIYERSLSTIIAQGKLRDSFDPPSPNLSEITRVVDCFFFFLLHCSLALAVSH